MREAAPRTENRGDAPAYFEAVHDSFLRAGQTAGGFVERSYVIGGFLVRLRFAGTALIPKVTPALTHLEAPRAALIPALTVCLWDHASTGVAPPPPVWGMDDQGSQGEIPGYNDGRISTAFNRGSNVLSMLDRDRDLALFWVRDEVAKPLPYYEVGAPLRAILHWWMADHGLQLIHAGAVGTPEGGVLLAGRGGSGKSTTSLSCLLSGMLYAGDDYVLVSPEPFVHGLYSSAKLHPDQLARLPRLAHTVGAPRQPDEEKTLLFLSDHFPERISTGFPIRAILLPTVTGVAAPRLRKTTAATSLAALAPSTMLQMPDPNQVALRRMTELVRRVPSYALELGGDVEDVPRVVATALVGTSVSA